MAIDEYPPGSLCGIEKCNYQASYVVERFPKDIALCTEHLSGRYGEKGYGKTRLRRIVRNNQVVTNPIPGQEQTINWPEQLGDSNG